MGLFAPKWKTNDQYKKSKAIEAVKKISDETELRQIAMEAPLPDVRMAAVYQMRDPFLLKEMAFSKDKSVSWAAIDNIADENSLAEIACGNGAAAGHAAKKVFNQAALAMIAQNAVNYEAREEAGKRHDRLVKLNEIVGLPGVDLDKMTDNGKLRDLINNFSFRNDQFHRIVAAAISAAKDAETADLIIEKYMSWGEKHDAPIESARLKKIEVISKQAGADDTVVMKCKKCGELVRYEGYFDSELRDSWVEKGDYVCGCIRHEASDKGFPKEPAWEPAILDGEIEGDKFRLCAVCMKPNGIDVNIKPLSRCINLDPDHSKDRLKHINSKYRGIYIPWKRAVW